MRNVVPKEIAVKLFVQQAFPAQTWVHDERVQDGCSRRRPDLLCDLGSHVVVIECDENQHAQYDCSCENRRLMEISQDLQHRPLVFVRFNPDSFVAADGSTVTSCWGYDQHGVARVKPSKRTEWTQRLEALRVQVQHWLQHAPTKTVEVVQMFYDQT